MIILYGCLVLLVLMFSGIGAGVIWIRGRPKIQYPDPESLIIQPQSHNDAEVPRILPFDGVANFRDLGGYQTRDGRKVRWRTVFRSGKWSDSQHEDLEKLTAFGVRLTCDLRSDKEVTMRPDRLPDGIAYHHLPINDDIPRWERVISLTWKRNRLPQQMQCLYNQLFIDNNPQVFGGVLRYLAEVDNLPALIHCNAGKDRAGIASALLLLTLGVPEETVIADYTLSNYAYAYFRTLVTRRVRRLRYFNVTTDDLYPLITANAQVMRSAIEHIKIKYGSVHAYLTGPAGLDEDTMELLRENLLE